MGIIEERIPVQAAVIHKRREMDPELDEICRDYETLATDLKNAERAYGPQENGLQANIRDSLNGLQAEIFAKLQGL